MKYLKAAATVRILDSLGVVSKEMHDIRHKDYLVNKDPEIFSGYVDTGMETKIVFLFSEKEGVKYMVTSLIEETKNDWICFIGGDVKDENPELNKIFVSYIKDDNFLFREASFFEVASILRSFEIIRDNIPLWHPYKHKKEYIEILMKFMNEIKIEEFEQQE